MKAHQAEHAVTMLCRMLGVSTSGYYAWLERPACQRVVDDRALTDRIFAIWDDSDTTYGAPRVHAELADNGIRIGRKRVARLMRAANMAGVTRRKWVHTTPKPDRVRPAPDLVQRNYHATAPNTVWVADITFIATWQGTVYLAAVQDMWSRRIVGWALDTNMETALIQSALTMAITNRKPTNVIHHSDQGSQYTSIAFGMTCHEHNVVPSMGTVGDCYDNAMAESFFATLKTERTYRRTYKTRQQAINDTTDWIEGWYNTRRRHSSINYQSPINYEQDNWPTNT